ncbi:MAG: TetR/AcrR family transcriptional regulator [Gemmatimonadota bacterium]|nr:TetR/AcrR family transcriptional regulator [Gemmatimonadota bacterium]MDH4347257.1 TetR/AcrR family transcriptional regulator [Gemmatimonadota bacterium]MDH5282280.1 TetR/AcrR family transcriptional regulator [Gemmatimonadota bacterium]
MTAIRERILTAAARVYGEAGFRGATTRRIAAEAAVNEVTLFRHFGSKTHLLHEAINHAARTELGVRLPDIPRNPRSELITWARPWFQALTERRMLIRTAMGEVAERPEVVPSCDHASRSAGALAEYLGGLRTHGFTARRYNARRAAAMLLGAMFADAMHRDIMPDLFQADEETAIAGYVDLLLAALGVEPVRPSSARRRKHA